MTETSRTLRCAVLLTLLTLGACSSGPKPADWQMEAKSAMDRALGAYLEGNSRIEAMEFGRVRGELSATGRIDLVARAELLRCASRVASLVLEPCAGFEPLRQDAPAAERAYADYLEGRLQAADVALLPASQRAAAAGSAEAAAVGAITDPLSQLVAAAVQFRTGRASPALVQLAVDTSSSQGWRRPLLAWLGVQLQLAEKGGDTEAAARVRRRIALTQNLATGSKP
jgi:hypothetical protein